MHSHIFNPQPTRPLDGQQYLVLHMPARTFSGLVVRRIILPYCLHPTYGTTGICSLVLFYDTRCTPNTLAFWRKTWQICYGLERSPFSSYYPTFSGGVSKVVGKVSDCALMFSEEGLQRYWQTFWIVLDLPIFFGGLWSCCWIVWSPHPRLEAFSTGYLSLVFPRYLGVFPKFLKVLLHNCERRPRKSALFLLFPSSHDREGFGEM